MTRIEFFGGPFDGWSALFSHVPAWQPNSAAFMGEEDAVYPDAPPVVEVRRVDGRVQLYGSTIEGPHLPDPCIYSLGDRHGRPAYLYRQGQGGVGA